MIKTRVSTCVSNYSAREILTRKKFANRVAKKSSVWMQPVKTVNHCEKIYVSALVFNALYFHKNKTQ